MANIQNDIFENQEIAKGTGNFDISKTGDVTCNVLTANELDVDTMSINEIEVGTINGLMFKKSNGMFLVSLNKGTTWYEVVLGGEVEPTERYTFYLIDKENNVMYTDGDTLPGDGQYIPIIADNQLNKIYINYPTGADIFRAIHEMVDDLEEFVDYSVKSKFTDFTVTKSGFTGDIVEDPGYDVGSFTIDGATATGATASITITVNDPEDVSGTFELNI